MLPAGAAHAAGTHFAGVYVSSVQGARDYDGYVPSSYRSGTALPLLVALHGCTETSGHLGVASGLTALAEQRGFIVVYPDQALVANPAQCWNWFLSKNQRRGSGEAAIIAGITNLVRSRYTVDSRRVFVTGISAGANMSVIMAVTYPDLYAAAGVVAAFALGSADQPVGADRRPRPGAVSTTTTWTPGTGEPRGTNEPDPGG